jgi:hypothetical protein
MFMSDWSALMTPQKATPGQDAYTFVIRILSMSFISVSFSLSAAALGYLSLWLTLSVLSVHFCTLISRCKYEP